MPTHFFHSGMTGAPTNTSAAGSTLNIFDACLNTGFNVRAVASANVTANVMTLTYASAHGYENLSTLRFDGAAGGSIVRRCTVTGANTLTIPVTGFANGAVAGTLETRVAPADWERVFTGTNVGVFRSKVIAAGSSRFFYRISDNVAGATPALLRGFETMTDANTGTGPFPTMSQLAGEGLLAPRATDATPRPWFVISDQRTCYFGLSASAFNGSANGFFGDFRPHNAADAFNGSVFIVSNAGFSGLGAPAPTGVAAYCARRANGLGSADVVTATIPFGSNSGGTRIYPSPITGAMAFARPILAIDGPAPVTDAIRGERRGLMHCSTFPISSGEQFMSIPLVQGIVGRVVVVREAQSTTSCIAFPIDEDWA